MLPTIVGKGVTHRQDVASRVSETRQTVRLLSQQISEFPFEPKEGATLLLLRLLPDILVVGANLRNSASAVGVGFSLSRGLVGRRLRSAWLASVLYEMGSSLRVASDSVAPGWLAHWDCVACNYVSRDRCLPP